MTDSRTPLFSVKNAACCMLLLLILGVGGVFRFTGINWDDNTRLHPDERFLTMVATDCDPVAGAAEYFNTSTSSLNPHNRGHGFYVYGTLPLFLTIYLAEWTGFTGYDWIVLPGRMLSALFDLLAVVLVFAIALRLYNRTAALCAAALSACSVLQIQLAHFFVVDTFSLFFSLCAVFFLLQAGLGPRRARVGSALVPGLAFGICVGLAAACKLNTAPLLVMLFPALLIRRAATPVGLPRLSVVGIIGICATATLLCALIFRVFQPYAFAGPAFWNISLNPQWLENIATQLALSSGDVDFPPALQWARRAPWFPWVNTLVWGMGPAFGLMGVAGFVWMGIRIVRGHWQRHTILWVWTVAYCVWQTMVWNCTMRYMLPIYPMFALMAGWAMSRLMRMSADTAHESGPVRMYRYGSWALCATVIAATLLWAFAFTRIYTGPATRVEASRWIYRSIPGPVNIGISDGTTLHNHILPFGADQALSADMPFSAVFIPRISGELDAVSLPRVVDLAARGPSHLRFSIEAEGDAAHDHVAAEIIYDVSGLSSPFSSIRIFAGQGFVFERGRSYRFTAQVLDGGAEFVFGGSALLCESSWDDCLPLRVDGYDGYGGIYRPGLNLELYAEENEDKRTRMLEMLGAADYFIITSNRQWGVLPRLPERYPLTTAFYLELMGCPPGMPVARCYERAGPGMFEGRLGFELREVFESSPALGPWRISDQRAEEAFTVYDHPKVFVFEKKQDFCLQEVRSLLHNVNLHEVLNEPLRSMGARPANMLLPPERLESVRRGGTWSELFNPASLLNRYAGLAAAAWYALLVLLGVCIYPLVRCCFSSLPDRGYPLSKTFALLLLAWIVWMAGSHGIAVSRVAISCAVLVLVLAGAWAAWFKRRELASELRERIGFFAGVELLSVCAFAAFLLIRWANPDLWHPYRGGEKPMDLAYFTAVLKSPFFPPYDPWFAGGLINYYYYGFVLVGVPVKLLGISPAVAYNIVLAGLFSLLAAGAFSCGWNMARASGAASPVRPHAAFWGMTAVVLVAVSGNLKTLWMAVESGAAYMRAQTASWMTGDWLWLPSRVIPAQGDVAPITEFPFFTFLYADLHAHLIAMPFSLLAFAWCLSLVLRSAPPGPSRLTVLRLTAALCVGGLIIGVFVPMNTWEYPTWLGFGACAFGIYLMRCRFPRPARSRLVNMLRWSGSAACALVLLAAVSHLFYRPFSLWYQQGYGAVALWLGPRTPISSYVTHFGVFLVCIVAWLMTETRTRLQRGVYASRAAAALCVLALAAGLGLWLAGIPVGLIAAALIVWCLGLAAWPDMPVLKRVVLIVSACAMVLTVMVELIVLRGDIGRMNTVFKFYLQAWMMLALCATAALMWCVQALRGRGTVSACFGAGLTVVLLACAGLYPIMGTRDKIRDRFGPDAPRTLDGAAYMESAVYYDQGRPLVLQEDYLAIDWMQEHVQGTPVLIEAHAPEYRWGARYSIYTGLPGVIGWSWHQRQQRSTVPDSWVLQRIADVEHFYTTECVQEAMRIVARYRVEYIIIGRLERAYYPEAGLEKFCAPHGRALWEEVFREGDTAVYRVLPQDMRLFSGL